MTKGSQFDWDSLWDTVQRLHLDGATQEEISVEIKRAITDVHRYDDDLPESENPGTTFGVNLAYGRRDDA